MDILEAGALGRTLGGEGAEMGTGVRGTGVGGLPGLRFVQGPGFLRPVSTAQREAVNTGGAGNPAAPGGPRAGNPLLLPCTKGRHNKVGRRKEATCKASWCVCQCVWGAGRSGAISTAVCCVAGEGASPVHTTWAR